MKHGLQRQHLERQTVTEMSPNQPNNSPRSRDSDLPTLMVAIIGSVSYVVLMELSGYLVLSHRLPWSVANFVTESGLIACLFILPGILTAIARKNSMVWGLVPLVTWFAYGTMRMSHIGMTLEGLAIIWLCSSGVGLLIRKLISRWRWPKVLRPEIHEDDKESWPPPPSG